MFDNSQLEMYAHSRMYTSADERRKLTVVARLTIKFLDYDLDVKQISIPSTDSSAVNYATNLALAEALQTAIGAVTGGTRILQAYTPDENVVASPTPPSQLAYQNHTQWLVTVQDTIDGHKETLSLPTADVLDNTLVITNTDQHDPAHADWIAFKSALEDFMDSNLGNPVTVVSIVLKE